MPCFVGKGALSASLVAKLVFGIVVRIFGVPSGVISDRDLGSLLPFGRRYGLCWGPSFL